jgi:hypothetical protein
MAIEIVSFPMKNGGSFHSYVNVYQREILVAGGNSKQFQGRFGGFRNRGSPMDG